MSATKETSIIYITHAADSSYRGAAIVEINGTKRNIALLSDYSIEYEGVRVFRMCMSVQTLKAVPLTTIVLAVQIAMVLKEKL